VQEGTPMKLPAYIRHIPDKDLTPEIKEQILRDDFENDQKLRFEPWRINPPIGGVVYILHFSSQRVPVYNGPLFNDNYPNNCFLNQIDIERAIKMITGRFMPVITKEFYAVNKQLDLFGNDYASREPVIFNLPDDNLSGYEHYKHKKRKQ
jgi:hypothetical protein